MATSPWVGMKWMALGLLALLLGICWTYVAARELRLWVYEDRYVVAELEVTRFIPKGISKGRGSSGGRERIDAVIHPGGEQVTTSAAEIPIKQFIAPDERSRNEPLKSEIEGKRVDVWHWPRQSEVRRWWHPPTVVARKAIPGGRFVLQDVLLAAVFLGAAWFCFRRGVRYLKAKLLTTAPVAHGP